MQENDTESAASTAPFLHRGVVEGFYGRRYARADRLWLVQQIGELGMNRYVYAPKDDPLGREDWREPYADEDWLEFSELVTRGRDAGVEVGFALSPGLSIEYASRQDVGCLQRKFDAFAEIGARFFCLALDDVPSVLQHAGDRETFESLAHAHVSLAHAVVDALPAEATLWLVPTDYAGVEPTGYLEHLGRNLAPEIEVGWTGRTVVSPTIPAEEARKRSETLGRRLLIWDNTPVNDGPMRRNLHLGPYLGRDPDLCQSASGLLLNPMELPRASCVGLQTAAHYMSDPAHYDPETAWRTALARVGAGAEAAFETFACAHRFSPLSPESRDDELEAAFDDVRRQFQASDREGERRSLARLRERAVERLAVTDTLQAELRDRRLLDEIEPWVGSHYNETQQIALAVDLLDALVAEEEASNALSRAIAFMGMEGRLTRLPISRYVSYGPRRALYPQLASLRTDEACFGDDRSLFLDQCLAEDILRFAEREALSLLRASRRY